MIRDTVLNKIYAKESGQSLVEFAISLTVIMILLAGAVEFGIALFQYVQLRDAAQEGALYGSLHPGDTDGIEMHTRAASNSPIDLQSDGDLSLDIEILNGEPACEGNSVQVSLSYPHRVIMPFLSEFIGSNTIPIDTAVIDTILLSDPDAGCE